MRESRAYGSRELLSVAGCVCTGCGRIALSSLTRGFFLSGPCLSGCVGRGSKVAFKSVLGRVHVGGTETVLGDDDTAMRDVTRSMKCRGMRRFGEAFGGLCGVAPMRCEGGP